ncbi:DHA2 family efflux MFS transporter permease subunit [Marinobacter sp. V034]|uniref:DHA2 family efflux MFS transporter permease subunit n=1 Tax=Marinobacter sp. V034 TaxID=3459610 RepID=UPI0040450E2F
MPQTLEQLQARFGEHYKWRVMLTAMIGTMTMSLSSTIVNVALPDIMRRFDVNHTAGQWLVTAFLSSMAVGMLVNAWAVHRFGARKTYFTTLTVFAVSSLIGGLSPSFEVLIGVRIMQGFLAGMVQPLALVIMYSVFPVQQRGQAMGLYAMGVVLGPTLGPVLGGILVDVFSWRAVFLIVLPNCLYALWLTKTYVATATMPEDKKKLDLTGLLLLTGWLVSLLWALSQGSHMGWQAPLILGAFGASASLFVLFILCQLKRRSPLLDMSLFRYAGITPAFLIAMLTGAGLFSSVYLLPLLVQTVMENSASASGLLLLPAGICMALTFPIVGRLTDRLAPGYLVGIGLVLFAGSSFVLSFATAGFSLTLLAIMASVGRIGLAMTMPPVVVQALSVLPPELTTQGTGLVSFARQFGGALGVSLAAVLLQEHSAFIAQLGYVSAAKGYQDAFALFALLFALGLIPLMRLPGKQPTT